MRYKKKCTKEDLFLLTYILIVYRMLKYHFFEIMRHLCGIIPWNTEYCGNFRQNSSLLEHRSADDIMCYYL